MDIFTAIGIISVAFFCVAGFTGFILWIKEENEKTKEQESKPPVEPVTYGQDYVPIIYPPCLLTYTSTTTKTYPVHFKKRYPSSKRY